MLFSLSPIEGSSTYDLKFRQLVDDFSELRIQTGNFSAMMAAYASGNAVPPELESSANLLRSLVNRVSSLAQELIPSTGSVSLPGVSNQDLVNEVLNMTKIYPISKHEAGIGSATFVPLAIVKTGNTNPSDLKVITSFIEGSSLTEVEAKVDKFAIDVQVPSNWNFRSGTMTVSSIVNRLWVIAINVPVSTPAITRSFIASLPASSWYAYSLQGLAVQGDLKLISSNFAGNIADWNTAFHGYGSMITPILSGLMSLYHSPVSWGGVEVSNDIIPTGSSESVAIEPLILNQLEPFKTISSFVDSITLG